MTVVHHHEYLWSGGENTLPCGRAFTGSKELGKLTFAGTVLSMEELLSEELVSVNGGLVVVVVAVFSVLTGTMIGGRSLEQMEKWEREKKGKEKK